VFGDTFFEKDLQAVAKAREIIDVYNAEGHIDRTIQLNYPAVWVFLEGSKYIHTYKQALQQENQPDKVLTVPVGRGCPEYCMHAHADTKLLARP
jgi:hypothetical protein